MFYQPLSQEKIMNKELNLFIKSLPTTPFLFVGSGLSRRYYNLPDWRSLLTHFIDIVTNNDPVGWAKYYQSCSENYAKIAEKLEIDFNERWFNDQSIRTLSPKLLNKVIEENCSPFKAEIASYLMSTASLNPKYEKEIEDLKNLTTRNIAGFITTNYDEFLEKIAPDYTVYIGQEELLFSSIQNIAEIYKIHGSVNEPSSIIITASDYFAFDNKAAYLSAKLLTIFLENPIIFIGYSITDKNIRKIITSIVNCLSKQNAEKLSNRFILIEHQRTEAPTQIISHMMDVNGQVIPMTKISLYNYSELYEALKTKQSTLPAKLLRMFKKDFYDYVLTNTPSKSLYVAGINDSRVADEDLVLAIASPGEIGIRGLYGLTSSDIYKDIILDNLRTKPDDILTYAYPHIVAANGKLPIFKYVFGAKGNYENIVKNNGVYSFDDIINNTIKKNRSKRHMHAYSVNGLKNHCNLKNSSSIKRLLTDICYLTEEQINLTELEILIKDIFELYPKILENFPHASTRTDLRRLIRIYDWLKYGKSFEK